MSWDEPSRPAKKKGRKPKAKSGAERVRDVLASAERFTGADPNWRDRLLLNKDDNARANLANAIIALRHAPEWAGALAFNEFADKAMLLTRPPWVCAGGVLDPREWRDHDDLKGAEWLQHNGVHVGVELTSQAVQAVAGEMKFHPVRDYLAGLKWDGVTRLDHWLRGFMGVDDSAYVRAVARRFMIAAVARIMEPGCKADSILVLEGPQGAGKSSALRTLAGDWFTDEIADFGSKEAAEQTAGVWIIEVAELEGIGRADVNKIKAFASRSTDRYRPAYGRRVREYPRQCVLVGTCNRDDYLRDETGNRRFWPVRCGAIDQEGLANVRNQLWAEAVQAYRNGESWWLDDPGLVATAADEAAQRYHEDPWDEPIRVMLGCRDEVSVADVLDRLAVPPDRRNQTDANRVARSLRAAGWGRRRSSDKDAEGKRPWVYVPV